MNRDLLKSDDEIKEAKEAKIKIKEQEDNFRIKQEEQTDKFNEIQENIRAE